MKGSGGKANPKLASDLLKRELGNSTVPTTNHSQLSQ